MAPCRPSIRTELAMNNQLATHFRTYFQMDAADASALAGAFGLMNLFARSLGGITSDILFKYMGFRGRIWAQFLSLFFEAIFLFCFGLVDNELFHSYVQPFLGAVSSGLAVVLGAKGCGGSGLFLGLSVLSFVDGVCNFKFRRRQSVAMSAAPDGFAVATEGFDRAVGALDSLSRLRAAKPAKPRSAAREPSPPSDAVVRKVLEDLLAKGLGPQPLLLTWLKLGAPLPKPPQNGPRVVAAYTQAQLEQVLSWAAAAPPTTPTTLVDFVSAEPSCPVLVSTPTGGITARKAKLHHFGAGAPKPNGLQPKPEFEDKAAASDATSNPDWQVFRLTLAQEYCDPNRFAVASKRPQALAATLLPGPLRERVVRTYAAASYQTEVTCLLRVRLQDASGFLQAALCPGAFLAKHRNPECSVQWLARDRDISAPKYLAKALAAAQASPGAVLAYRPGGKANLGLRLTGPPSGGAVEGGIAPRWVVSCVPRSWLNAEVEEWLSQHGFLEPSGIHRLSADAWSCRAWPKEGAGAAMYASGIVVAPASSPRSRRKAGITGPALWGTGAVPQAAQALPAPTTAEAEDSNQEPGAGNTDSDMPDAAASVGEASKRGQPPRAKEPAAKRPKSAKLRPQMPFARRFVPQECGRAGDCAYTSVAKALATFSASDAFDKDLQPAGRLQAFLRCEAAKYIRAHKKAFSQTDVGPEEIAERTATAGVWANSLSLTALAGALKLQLRVWAYSEEQGMWTLYLLGPDPSTSKKKGGTPPCVWLKLEEGEVAQALVGAGLLGLDQAVQNFTAETKDDSDYAPGQLYNCSCGWVVPTGLRGNRANAAAVAHWRQCKGTRPPTAASQNVRRRVALKGLAASEPRRARAWKAFQAHLSKLKGAKWEDAACTPVQDLVTRHDWIAKTVGLEAAAHFKSQERLGHCRFVATAKGKLAQKRANANRNKERHDLTKQRLVTVLHEANRVGLPEGSDGNPPGVQRRHGKFWAALAKVARSLSLPLFMEFCKRPQSAVPPVDPRILPKSRSLDDQFAAWHEAAEAFCQQAVQEGLATVERKAERPKGSRATTRPVAEPKLCCELETVELRRWRRLYRAAAEQERRSGPAAVMRAGLAVSSEEAKQRHAWQLRWKRQFRQDALRPIAVESAALRAFNRALLWQFPPLPQGQFCGVKGETAASATVAWLRTDAVRGAELDLRKAFDTVHHAVARAAALAAGVPAPIVEFLARFVWPAPRCCVVHGAAAARPVYACTGLPAGDPCSPSLLAYVLAPWRSLVESCPGIRAFLFMDDRSLVELVGRRASEDALASALALSQWSDETLGLQEHQGKRQLWDRTANPDASVEHLGITTAPGSQVVPELRVSEPQFCSLASAVTCLPGGMAVTERLLQGLVLPKLLWSAPLTPKLSPAVTEAFYRAI
ncbi:NRT2.1 [Symbiodinium sp. CCMP2592]|nr:NRT2.1 [Symbiodinium sp. CCMP2592]